MDNNDISARRAMINATGLVNEELNRLNQEIRELRKIREGLLVKIDVQAAELNYERNWGESESNKADVSILFMMIFGGAFLVMLGYLIFNI